MAYYGMGLGALGQKTWCSDRNPQPGCKALGGICKPMDHATLAVYKNLQYQANRLASLTKLGTIDQDGRIGPKTVALVAKILGRTPWAHCDELAIRADEVASQLQIMADDRKAPVAVFTPGKSPPSMPLPDGGVLNPEVKQAGFGALLTSPIGLAAMGVGALLLLQDKKKRGRKKGLFGGIF